MSVALSLAGLGNHRTKAVAIVEHEPAERRVQRLLLGHASECQMDGAGRILLSPTLTQHAGLSKEVMVVGQFNKFEFWDEQTWYQQVKDDIDAQLSAELSLTDRLQDLSL